MTRPALMPTITDAAMLLTAAFPLALIGGHVVTDIALSLLAVLLLARSLFERNWRWCDAAWVRCLLLLWLYMFVRGFFTDHWVDALRRSLPFGRYVLFAAALATWTLRDTKTQRRFTGVLVAMVLFLALDGLLQWRFGFDIFGRRGHLNPEYYMRLTGPFHHQILGIMLTWLSFPVCLWLLLTEHGTFSRGNRLMAGIISALVIMMAIMVSGERMALMLALLGWAITALLLPVRKRYLFAGAGGMAALLAALILLSPKLAERQLHSTIDVLTHWQESVYGKLLMSDAELIQAHPLVGVGINQYRTSCTDYVSTEAIDPGGCNTHPHQMYMELLIENGVLGFALFIAALFFVLRDVLRAYKHHRRDRLYLGWLVALCLRLWPLASTTSFFSPWGAPPFWLALGAILVYSAVKGEKNENAFSAVAIQNAGL